VTKVDLRCRLERPLDEQLAPRLRQAASTYGILKVSLEEFPKAIFLQYDASRLSRQQALKVLHELGIPATEEKPD